MESVESGECVLCTKPDQTLRCSRCKRAYYCSKEHQRDHWKEHRLACKLENVTNNDCCAKGKSQKATPVKSLATDKCIKSNTATAIENILIKKANTNGISRNAGSIFTHVGSSESEILDCKAQTLSPSVDIEAYLKLENSSNSIESTVVNQNMPPNELHKNDRDRAQSPTIQRAYNSSDMNTKKSYHKYPETKLLHSGSVGAPVRSQIDIDAISRNILNDLELFGVCVVDNFLGKIT